jgi:hypothetical protein
MLPIISVVSFENVNLTQNKQFCAIKAYFLPLKVKPRVDVE